MNTISTQEKQKTAVAIYFDGEHAPQVTAKGQGLTGERIVQLALEHGVPLYENNGLADALSHIPLGEEIPQELYLVIAEILAFIYYLDEVHVNTQV